MRHNFLPAVLVIAILTVACSPGLNWREVRLTSSALVALFPCKPDNAERRLPFGEKTVVVQMLACEAEGAVFTLASADLSPDFQLGDAIQVWQAATLRQAKAAPAEGLSFAVKGALLLPQSSKIVAAGVKPDGSAVTVYGAWFAQGRTVYQAAVYSSGAGVMPHPSAAETYFSGLHFQ